MNCGFVGNAVLSPCRAKGPNEAQGRSPSPHGADFTEEFVGGASCLDVCNSTRITINLHLNVVPYCINRNGTQRLFHERIINRDIYSLLVSEMYSSRGI